MIDEIVIVGRPGLVGGADTELFDQIKVWLHMGLKCRVIPTSESKYPINFSHPNLVIEEIKRYNACSGKHVISFCNQHFLSDIEIIRKYAKSISWVNCMCFNFNKEIEAHKNGLIDYFLYQTRHQYELCGTRLLAANKNFCPIPITPYFDISRFPFINKRDELLYGRISRSGIDKYSEDQFYIYANCDKKSIVLGWSDEISNIYKSDKYFKYLKDNNLITLYQQNEITSQEFYTRCSVMCMKCNTFENLPRVGFECMASGCVMIVDNRGGWKDQIDNGKTGYLCNDKYEFTNRLNYLVKNPDIISLFAKNARDKLEAKYSLKQSASRWQNFFKLLT